MVQFGPQPAPVVSDIPSEVAVGARNPTVFDPCVYVCVRARACEGERERERDELEVKQPENPNSTRV